jgi:hypothetical protein
VIAVLEFKRSSSKREKHAKGKKIIEVFLHRSSPFQIIQDIPDELILDVGSSRKMEATLLLIKNHIISTLLMNSHVEVQLKEYLEKITHVEHRLSALGSETKSDLGDDGSFFVAGALDEDDLDLQIESIK